MTSPQTLVMFKGMMGVGKSAVSRALGRQLRWPVVDKDDFSDVLLNHLEPHGSAAYDCMFSAAESLLSQGFSVICDSPLRGELGFERSRNLATRVGAKLRVVVCILADEGLWKTRLETRKRRPAHILKDWADLTRYREQAARDFDYLITSPMLELDMSASLETLLEHVATWLQTTEEVR